MPHPTDDQSSRRSTWAKAAKASVELPRQRQAIFAWDIVAHLDTIDILYHAIGIVSSRACLIVPQYGLNEVRSNISKSTAIRDFEGTVISVRRPIGGILIRFRLRTSPKDEGTR